MAAAAAAAAASSAHTPNLIVHGGDGGSGSEHKVERDAGREQAESIPYEFLPAGIEAHVEQQHAQAAACGQQLQRSKDTEFH